MTEGIDIRMTLSKAGENKLVVTVLPVHDQLNDNAKSLIQPLNLNGNLQDFSENFFVQIQKPLEQSTTLLCNMDSFIKAMQKAQAQSKMEEQKKEKEKKEKEERKKRYEAMMKKVTELEGKEKWGEALGAMPKPKEFPEHTSEIEKKIKELREKHGTLPLFTSL
jgi:PRTRC genetic system protein E